MASKPPAEPWLTMWEVARAPRLGGWGTELRGEPKEDVELGKIVVSDNVSLDGVIQDPAGEASREDDGSA